MRTRELELNHDEFLECLAEYISQLTDEEFFIDDFDYSGCSADTAIVITLAKSIEIPLKKNKKGK